MRTRPLAYSLARLMGAALAPTPRGIDKIDFGLLTHLFGHWPGECFGVAPTLLGPQLFDRARVLAGCRRLAEHWHETRQPEDDPAYLRVAAQLRGEANPGTPAPAGAPASRRGSGLARALTLMFADGLPIGPGVGRLPPDSLFLDMGHVGLTFPTMTGWLARRPDIVPVVMIHDIIPQRFPAYEKPETVARHARALARAQAIARLVITPTPAVAADVSAYFSEHGARQPDVSACALPVDALFLAPQPPRPATLAPYCVVCGTIEPRKNQLLLLDVWERLMARLGDRTPALVVAGARGAGAGALEARLASNPALAAKVFIASGLGSHSIARLVAQAEALLMPSHAEGFGLPPLEAITLKTPALVSDLAAHRDALGDFGVFLPDHAAEPWVEALEAMILDPAAREALHARIAPHRPRGWADFGAAVAGILKAL